MASYLKMGDSDPFLSPELQLRVFLISDVPLRVMFGNEKGEAPSSPDESSFPKILDFNSSSNSVVIYNIFCVILGLECVSDSSQSNLSYGKLGI